MPQKKKTAISNTQIAVGAGIGAAVLAAAAGTYFLYGKDAPKRRKAVRSWMLKAKGEILEQIEKLPDLDQATYFALIDTASQKYAGLKDVSSAEVADLVKELRSHWRGIKKQLTPKKPVRKAMKKMVKQAPKKRPVKKVAKKGSKKSYR
jgi:hypothetical protein